MTDLKPCPFCGSSAMQDNSFTNVNIHTVRCSSSECFASNYEQDEQGGFGIEFSSEEKAAKAWNARPKSEAEELLEWLDQNLLSVERTVHGYVVLGPGTVAIFGEGLTSLDALRAAREKSDDL